MQVLRGFIEQKMQAKPIRQLVDEKTITFVFEKKIRQLFGTSGVQSVAVSGYRDGVLSLEVKKSVWQTELELQKELIKDALNTEFSEKVVDVIYINRK